MRNADRVAVRHVITRETGERVVTFHRWSVENTRSRSRGNGGVAYSFQRGGKCASRGTPAAIPTRGRRRGLARRTRRAARPSRRRGAGRARARALTDLSKIADRDPRLEERAREWAHAIGVTAPDGKEDEYALKAVDWRMPRPGAETERGRRKVLEGILLMRAYHPEEAERVSRGAEAVLGKHHNSAGGSVEAAAESAATRTVDRLVLEIENDRVVRSDVSVELGCLRETALLARPRGGVGRCPEVNPPVCPGFGQTAVLLTLSMDAGVHLGVHSAWRLSNSSYHVQKEQDDEIRKLLISLPLTFCLKTPWLRSRVGSNPAPGNRRAHPAGSGLVQPGTSGYRKFLSSTMSLLMAPYRK